MCIRDRRYPGRIHPSFLQKNLGSPAETRNWALNSGFIDGKYVVFLDGDDSLEPEYLERLHMLALQSGADTVICAYDRVEEKSSRVLCTEMQGFPQMISLPPKDDTLAFVNGALWNKLFRSDIALAHRIPDFKVGEDLCYQQAIYRDCSKIACTDEVLIHYRVREASVISLSLIHICGADCCRVPAAGRPHSISKAGKKSGNFRKYQCLHRDGFRGLYRFV